jgi:hypothetical protein
MPPPNPVPYQTRGCGVGWGAAAAGIEADRALARSGPSSSAFKRSDKKTKGEGEEVIKARQERARLLNKLKAPSSPVSALRFSTAQLGWHLFASDSSKFANLKQHVQSDKHLDSMAALNMRVCGLQGLPTELPKPPVGYRLCTFLLPEDKQLRVRGGSGGGSADSTVDAGAGGLGAADGDDDDFDGRHMYARDGIDLEEDDMAAAAAVPDYDTNAKKWVRCRSCGGAHLVMKCCIGECTQWCTATVLPGTNTAAISCNTHPIQYTHIVPQ